MPTIIRKSGASFMEAHRGVFHAVSWQVGSTIWSPPTDVYETEGAYVVRVEIPGMREEDFEVAFENNVLMISGFRSDRAERRAYHQMEIRFGKFATAAGLSGPVDVDNAQAEYAEGFLTVTLPKTRPNQVKVE